MIQKINKKLTIGGLCSGVGGIELGFKNAGFKISWANDMDAHAMKTYNSIIGANHYIGKKSMKISDITINHSSELENWICMNQWIFRVGPIDDNDIIGL